MATHKTQIGKGDDSRTSCKPREGIGGGCYTHRQGWQGRPPPLELGLLESHACATANHLQRSAGSISPHQNISNHLASSAWHPFPPPRQTRPVSRREEIQTRLAPSPHSQLPRSHSSHLENYFLQVFAPHPPSSVEPKSVRGPTLQ